MSDRKKGDLLVLSEGDRQGEVVRPGDLTLGGPPVHAWPQDPKSSVIRKGPRLNEILVIKLDPGELDEETRSRSADGIVAYSVICTHAGFPVSDLVTTASSTPGKRASRVRACPDVWPRFRSRSPTVP